ncbi:MAG: hypothetical protein IJM76_06060 [Lachnospiraceae bacterium]|nr:hypothetical protein [Lachnospiraceae bacterium]
MTIEQLLALEPRQQVEFIRNLRALIEKAAVSLSDEDALSGIELFPVWKPDVTCENGVRLRYGEKLYRVRQAHTSSELYVPGGEGTQALYEEVERPGQGDSPSNPISYNNNMKLIEGKYYSQNGVVYECFRSTGAAVYNDLSALVDIYVHVYE